jgi:hypothetical protein
MLVEMQHEGLLVLKDHFLVQERAVLAALPQFQVLILALFPTLLFTRLEPNLKQEPRRKFFVYQGQKRESSNNQHYNSLP